MGGNGSTRQRAEQERWRKALKTDVLREGGEIATG
jgi:hypothetical protein